MRVLLVDDEIEFVSTLAERLVFRGIDAQWVTTFGDAIEKVEAEPFDIAILDVKMPKLGGLALKEKLQAERPEMKFIFLTGYGSENDFNTVSSQLGEQFYLIKPVDIDALIAKLKSIVDEEGSRS